MYKEVRKFNHRSTNQFVYLKKKISNKKMFRTGLKILNYPPPFHNGSGPSIKKKESNYTAALWKSFIETNPMVWNDSVFSLL